MNNFTFQTAQTRQNTWLNWHKRISIFSILFPFVFAARSPGERAASSELAKSQKLKGEVSW
jgi:hypothetical protein